MFAAAIAAAWFAAAPVAWAGPIDDAPIVVPFRRSESGHIVIEVGVEGGAPVTFVVDTGANVTAVSPEAFAASGGDPDRGFLVRGRGAGGAVAGMRVVQGLDLQLAGRTFEIGAGVVMPLPSLGPGEPPLAGLLGRDVLRRHVVEIDDRTATFTLHPEGAVLPVADDDVVLPMRRVRGGLTVVTAFVEGQRADAVLDVGASVTVLNGPASRLDGVAHEAGCVASILGADGDAQDLDCVRLQSFLLGELELGPTSLNAADLDIFRVLRLSRRPALFLGNDVFAGRRMILDDGRGTLTLSRERLPPR